MIKAIALDDEPLALGIMQQFCSQNKHVDLLATFSKTNDALQFIAKNKIDLIFLDIDMPSISGLDFYKSLPYQPQFILATAYQQFALEGFNLNATDYLLKPFTQERFNQAVEKAKRSLSTAIEEQEPAFIWVKVDAGNIKLHIDSILWIEALDNYIKLHLTEQKTLLTRMPMKNILEALPAKRFVRVHRSYAVAVGKVLQVNYQEVFVGNAKIPIGNLYKENVEQVLKLKS